MQSENEVYNSLEMQLNSVNATLNDVLEEVGERRSDFRKLKVGIYEDQAKTRESLESFNATLTYLGEETEALEEEFAHSKREMLLQETRMEKIVDEKYDDFTEKFREIDEKIATLQNSSEQNSQNDQNFQIQSQLLKILNRLEILESSKHVNEERMKRMEENFQKEKADLMDLVEKAEEKSRRATRSVDKVKLELEQLKQSIEKQDTTDGNNDDDKERKCMLTCKEYDNGFKIYSERCITYAA